MNEGSKFGKGPKRKSMNSRSASGIQDPKYGFQALCEEVKFKNPKGMSFGHKQNIASHKAEGDLDQEFWFVLVDYKNGNEQIKRKAMSHLEASIRNQALTGTGIAWAKSYK